MISIYKYRLGAVLFLTAFFITAFLPVLSYGEGPNVLMFLWQGETGAEKGFRDALAEEFHDQNINYTVLDVYRDNNRLRDLIEQTNQAQYQLIYTYGSTVSSRVAKSYESTPVLFNIVFDPIGYKLIESWDRKQPNLTGVSNSIPVELLVKKMQDAFGKGDLGMIYNPLDKNSVSLKEELESCVAQSGAELASFEFRENFSALATYLDSIKDRVKCIYLPTEYLITGYLQRILGDINKRKIPSCVTSKSYLDLGALMCISADYYDVGKIAGRLAAKILKGTDPAELPVQRPSESDITLYVKSTLLKRFNIQIPENIAVNFVK
ncbi:ABC transporter substrate-binding protein [bacterium]|nr:ABC transporter substrate-binding protein [bacterium]